MSFRSTLLLAALATLSSVAFSDAPKPAAPDRSSQAAAEYLTKLRKLHLVRPDLIGYPLVVDFIC